MSDAAALRLQAPASSLPAETGSAAALADGDGFCELVRQTFAAGPARVVLRAYQFAVERAGPDLGGYGAVVDVLMHQHADHLVIAAALLAALRRWGLARSDELEPLFGSALAGLVERALATDALRADSEAHRKQDLQAWLGSIAGDARVVTLRAAFRLIELEDRAHVQPQPPDTDSRLLAQETLDLYVPLANRLGMKNLCRQLEDVCFRLLEPTIYAEIARAVEPVQAEDEACLELLKKGVQRLLDQNGISATVHSRRKGLYSLYRKMRRRGLALHQVMDKLGLRIIVPSVEACYTTLDLLHRHFRPVPGTLDDYIACPKANGYQSLHTCIYPVPDVSLKPVEFQIRTLAMHREAEFGAAAHWLYKSESEALQASEQQAEWLRGLLAQREQATTHAEFIEQLCRQVFGTT